MRDFPKQKNGSVSITCEKYDVHGLDHFDSFTIFLAFLFSRHRNSRKRD